MQEQSIVELSGDLSGSRDSAGVSSGSLQGRWLHVPVEIKAREFDSKLLLACCAVERGARSLIEEFGLFNGFSDKMLSGVVYEKDLSPREQWIFEKYRQNGHRIVANDEESLAIYDWPEMFYYDRVCDKADELTDLYFSWGKRQTELMEQLAPDLGPKLRTVGSQRTDLQRPPLRSFYDEAANCFRKRFSRFILFPSNFGSMVTVPKARATRIRESAIASETFEARDIRPFLPDKNGAPHPSVEFLRKMGPEKIEHLKQVMVGIVNPTGRTERCSSASLEIQAAGTAVVAGARDGLFDTVRHGETGFLVRGPEELARRIAELLSAPEQAEAMGKAGRAFVERYYDPALVAQKWRDLLHALERGDPPSAPPRQRPNRLPSKRPLLARMVAFVTPRRSAESGRITLQQAIWHKARAAGCGAIYRSSRPLTLFALSAHSRS